MYDERIPVLPEEPLKIGTALALDIGTETVGAYLYDAAAGKCIASAGEANAQKIFGVDLMSRIAYAENDRKFLQETAVIREQVYDLILKMCKEAENESGKTFGPADIHYVSVAGNTVMEHLYGAVSPKPIGIPPYRPVTLFGEQIIAEPTMYFCPCISGFAGGDLTAGLVSSGLAETEENCLYLDLGKGFSMALGNKEGFLCGAGAEAGEIPGMLKKLLKEKNTGREAVKKVLIAGAYGAEERSVLNILQEAGLAGEILSKAEYIGNAAGYGACLALIAENREKIKKTAGICRAAV